MENDKEKTKTKCTHNACIMQRKREEENDACYFDALQPIILCCVFFFEVFTLILSLSKYRFAHHQHGYHLYDDDGGDDGQYQFYFVAPFNRVDNCIQLGNVCRRLTFCSSFFRLWFSSASACCWERTPKKCKIVKDPIFFYQKISFCFYFSFLFLKKNLSFFSSNWMGKRCKAQ